MGRPSRAPLIAPAIHRHRPDIAGAGGAAAAQDAAAGHYPGRVGVAASGLVVDLP
jgi:hypothetical protein